MKVARLMTTDIATCRTHDSLERAAQLMWDRDIGAVPVVDDDGRIVGIVTDRDICMATYTRDAPPRAISVTAAMAQRVFSCGPDDDIRVVEKEMSDRQIRRVPVLDQAGRPIGIVSLNDIARASGREVSAAEVASTLAAVCAPRTVIASA